MIAQGTWVRHKDRRRLFQVVETAEGLVWCRCWPREGTWGFLEENLVVVEGREKGFLPIQPFDVIEPERT